MLKSSGMLKIILPMLGTAALLAMLAVPNNYHDVSSARVLQVNVAHDRDPMRLPSPRFASTPTPSRGSSSRIPTIPVQTDGFTLTGTYQPELSNGEPPTIYSGFDQVVIGDVTGDGRDDLIAAGSASNESGSLFEAGLYVYPQLSNKALGEPAIYPTGASVRGLALADLNGDGIQDVVITRHQEVSAALSDGSGGLHLASVLSTVYDNGMIDVPAVTMDINNDGNQDVVVHVAGSSSAAPGIDRRSRFRIAYGDGSGGILGIEDMAYFGIDWGQYEGFDSEAATSFLVTDLNNDGYQDLAMASRKFVFAEQSNPPFISIYLNDRAGGLLNPQVIPASFDNGDPSYTVLEHIGSGDFNDDGRQDLVAATATGQTQGIFVFLQSSYDTFDDAYTYGMPAQLNVSSVQGADLDADGDDDLLVEGDGGVFSYRSQLDGLLTDGIFVGLSAAPSPAFAAASGPNAIASGDLNSDGRPDVAKADPYSGLLVFLGTSSEWSHPTRNRGPHVDR